MKKKINRNYLLLGSIIIISFLVGWFVKPSNKATNEASSDQMHVEADENQIWTCSMHPQIRANEPGQCPICGMDLIPLESGNEADENPMAINMSPRAMQLANVQTMVVGYEKPVKEVRMPGKIQADERLVYSQATHIPGRIEQLMVNFTGEEVNKGQTLAMLYSPDLATAQDELFEAYKIRESQPALYQAARGKLMNWKLSEKQIDDILLSGKPQEQFPVMADVSGIVFNKRVNLGDYIQKGQSLFEIADLSKIWVLFDVYESDMLWVRKGALVEFTVQSFPGENFKGYVSFIDPVIDPKTRVAKARVEFSNRGNKLKPEMFVMGVIKSPITNKKEELIIPKSAVMWTGERSVIYVKDTSASGTYFLMREITLGPALGNSFIVKEGLKVGEEIAVNGTFSIDAASQLAGKPSMMNPEGGPSSTGHNHGDMLKGSSTVESKNTSVSKKEKALVLQIIDEYLVLKNALVGDDFEVSMKFALALQAKMKKINMGDFAGEAHNAWMKYSQELDKILTIMSKGENQEALRKQFKPLSNQVIQMAKYFGPFDEVLYVQHCPMADNDTGADWISAEKGIRNPYFGSAMLKCGETTLEIK